MISGPWPQDAAEFDFSALSHLPWAVASSTPAMPIIRIAASDIVVADPIWTLTTFGKETVVSESEKNA
ncbi:hypothetical protein ACNKHU_08510 [Shigella flexneri]